MEITITLTVDELAAIADTDASIYNSLTTKAQHAVRLQVEENRVAKWNSANAKLIAKVEEVLG